MKNRIWYKLKGFCMASLLIMGIMGGCRGEMAGASSVNVENKEESCTPTPETVFAPKLTPELIFTPTGKPEGELAPTEKPEGEFTPTEKPEGELAPTEKPEGELAPTEKPEGETAPTAMPELTFTPGAVPEEEFTPTSVPEAVPGPTTEPEADDEKEETPETVKKTADFRLAMEGGTEQMKAGQILTYEVVLENSGDIPLKELQLKSTFAKKGPEGHWEEAKGLTVKNSREASLELLETGEERKFYYQVRVPEDYQETMTHTVQVSAANPAQTEAQEPYIIRSTSVHTEILPLLVDFEVKKTADRKTAAPGDTITYQICIRNTGERTLHSVLTTERFHAEDIHAEFVEKEGAVLNRTRNQALIAKIEPGEAFGLQAVVTLPEEITGQKLLNEVVVVTNETGKKTVKAQTNVQVHAAKPTETPTSSEHVQEEGRGKKEPGARAASTSPKTGDSSKTEALAGAMGIAMLAGVCVYWYRKAKRKH